MSALDINKLVERLPYADGSGRRRFVSGGIMIFGIILFFWKDVEPLVAGIQLLDLIKSPIIVAGIILLIYAVGNVVEMFNEFFLIRAVSGLFYTIERSIVLFKEKKYFKFLFQLYSLPFYFLIGLAGASHYELNLPILLSNEAKNLYLTFPEKIKKGLFKPVGDNFELAIKYVIDQLADENDQGWAKRLISRTKDISVLSSSLLILMIIAILLNRIPISTFRYPAVILIITAPLFIGPFLFLYIGFFKSLRVAIISILELHVLKNLKKVN